MGIDIGTIAPKNAAIQVRRFDLIFGASTFRAKAAADARPATSTMTTSKPIIYRPRIGSLGPILNLQPRHIGKVFHVVGHDGEIVR